MPFISVNLNDPAVQESRPAPAGRYELVVLDVAEVATKSTGKPQLLAILGFEGVPKTPNIRHYMSLPNPGDDPDKAAFKMLLLKRFCHGFRIPYDDHGFDTDSMLGARASLEIALTEPDDSGNVYNRLVLPRLPDEGGTTAGRRAPPPPKS